MANATVTLPPENGPRTPTRTSPWAIVLLVGLGVGFVVGWLIGRGGTPQPVPVPTPVVTIEARPTPTPVPTTPLPTPACTRGVAQDWKLYVGPDDPCRVVDGNGKPVPLAYISSHGHNKIEFRPLDSKKKLEIIIHVPPDFPPLFKNLAPNTYDQQNRVLSYRVFCNDFANDKLCSTGLAQDLDDSAYICYKYDQVLNGKPCDAHIIIQP
jgi:hypothetical protein